MTEWFWNCIIYSFCGYLLERLFAAVTKSSNQVRRCFRFLPLCPVYGLAVTAVLALPPDLLQLPWLPIWGSLVTTAVEYAVHWLYESCVGVHFWDYSPLRFQIHGRICLPFSIAWGLLVTAAVLLLQPVFNALIPAIPPTLTWFSMLVITGDGLITLRYLLLTGDITFTVPLRRWA